MGRLGEFIANHWLLTLALVIIIVLLIMDALKRRVLGFQDIKPQEAVRLINHEGAVTLDVREDGEYQEGHILNAVHVPLGLLDERLHELESYKVQPLVVYCRAGQRAAHACVALRKHGFERVFKLSGGMMAWRSANLPVVK